MAGADPLDLASDPSNATLGGVDLDEVLNLMKSFPAEELTNSGFTTYGEVHNLFNNDWNDSCDAPHGARCRHLHATMKR